MNSSSVFVGGLPSGIRERDLERFFKGCGRMEDILLKNGYGFVEFENSRDAKDAVHALDGKELLGRRIVVELAKSTARGGGGGYRDRERDRYDDRRRGGRNNDRNSRQSRFGPPKRTEYRLTVENLSSRVSWQDLKDYVRQAGEVTYCDAHRERRNEGVVEFISRSDMRAAFEKLNDTDLNGRRIRLVEYRYSRRGGGRGGRSRSRSDSRRRSRSKSRRRSETRGSRSKSKSAKSKSRSHSRSKKSRSRSASRDSRSRSRSNAGRDLRSSSKSRRDSRDRSKFRPSQRGLRSPVKSRRDSRSRDRSRSHRPSKSAHGSPRVSHSRSRSASPRNGNNSTNRDVSMDE